MDVLKKIDWHRMQRGWSEYELALHAELPQSTISTWFRKGQLPTIRSLEKVCNAFGLTLSQFFAEEGDLITLNAEQKELLDSWSALSPKQKELFLELFRQMP